jgi:hypothetical protein
MSLSSMKWIRSIVCASLIAAPVFGAEDEEEFTPRSSAPPAARTGGASRGGSSEASAATVSILAPASTVGLTTREQPIIYWNLTADTKHPIEIAINDPAKLENPVAEMTIKSVKAGIQKLDLSKLKKDDKSIKLEPGKKYDVVIEVAASENGASENPNASCRIMRLDPKEIPDATKKEQDKAKLAAIYAKEGIWFDYLDAMNAAIEAKPDDKSLVEKRNKALAAQRLIVQEDGKIVEKSKADDAKNK